MAKADNPGGIPSGADDFDSVAWCYDRVPVPTHPKHLAPRMKQVQGPIVDLGGGTGKYTMRILSEGHKPTIVVDPARKMLAKGRRKGRDIGFIQAMGESLPIPDSSVAGVVITEAFHHFGRSQPQVVKEIARILRSDGLLLIEEPDPGRFFGRLMAWGERLQGMSSVFHRPAGLVAMLEPCFGSVTVHRTGWFTYAVECRNPNPAG